MASPWSGLAQSGSRDYESADVERVLDALPAGRQDAVTLQTFSESLGMDGRQVRAILSDRDGIDFLLAIHEGTGLMCNAEFLEDATAHTEKLRARAQTLMARVARRERYGRTNLERRQPRLIA